jgi:hypothetical protein
MVKRGRYMKNALVLIRDIVLERCDVGRECLKMGWDFYAQRARIWRQYKNIEKMEDVVGGGYGLSRVSEALDHIQGEEQLLDRIATLRLARIARRYGLEMPSRSDEQNYGKVDFEIDEDQPEYLTQQGFREMREALRVVRRERREAAGFLFGIVVGVLGAVTGLVAVFHG